MDGSRIGLLQFAAKAHEILMQVSIVAVVVAYVQYLLTAQFAIPFGALFSAYQVSQMSYLLSPEFYAAVTARGFPLIIKAGFSFFVPASILLANAVGLSSAISMQPRMTNYSLPEYELALNASSDILYPRLLNKAGPLQLGFSLYSDSYDNQVSPAAGWEYLQGLPAVGQNEQTATGLNYPTVNTGHGTGMTAVIMPPLYSVQVSTMAGKRTLYVQYAPNSTFATTQQVPVASSLSKAAHALSAHLPPDTAGKVISSISMPQPYVSVFCELNTIMNESNTRLIQFPDTYVAGCGSADECANQNPMNMVGTINYTGITRRELWTEAKRRPQGRMIWVDDIHISRPIAGLGVIVVQPDFCTAGNNTFLTTSACVVSVRWANTTSIMQLAFDGFSQVSKDITDNIISSTTPSTLPDWSRPSVAFSKQWAESLNPLTSTQNWTVADNLLRTMPVTDNICPRNGSYEQDNGAMLHSRNRLLMHEALIASLIANGMSNAAGITEQWTQKSSKNKDNIWTLFNSTIGSLLKQSSPPGIVLTFQGSLPGYAWSLDSSSIILALTVLIIYCLYTIVYLAYVFSTGHSSMAWSTISGLTALAINSRPTHALRFTSAGIEWTDTFRNLVSVREIEGTGRLELVFKQDEENRGVCRRVTAGKAY